LKEGLSMKEENEIKKDKEKEDIFENELDEEH
jgi:hypothetical protein